MVWNKAGTCLGLVISLVNKVNLKFSDLFCMLRLTGESELRYNSGIDYGWRPDNTARDRHHSWRAKTHARGTIPPHKRRTPRL